jgi:hypothetical protein
MERNRLSKELCALEILSSEAYLVLNKKLLQHYGPDVSVFLSNLIDKYKYFRGKGDLLDGRWFYLIHVQQIEQTGLTIEKIRTCKKILKEDNILQTKRKGIPSKEYYSLDFDHLMEIIPLIASPRDSLQQAIGLDQQLYNNNKVNNNKKLLRAEDGDKQDYKQEYITPSMFDMFWTIYPKHVDKGKALTVWKRICNRPIKDKPTWHEIKSAIIHQRRSERWQDPKFIPHPTTWLNQSRWLDDPSEMKSYNYSKEEEPTCPLGFRFGVDHERFAGCETCDDADHKVFAKCKLANR